MDNHSLLKVIHYLSVLVLFLLVAIVLIPIIIWKGDAIITFFTPKPKTEIVLSNTIPTSDTFWHPRELAAIDDSNQKKLIEYGKELIVHTASYLGPQGTVAHMSNGMNCQNCHLDAGTRVYGNNYGSVFSQYPKFRARSGTEESIFKRINDCFERSLNGKALDSNKRELQAMKAYIMYIGSNVMKGKKGAGSGLKEMEYLAQAANPIAGQTVYQSQCMSCHGKTGNGQLTPDGKAYAYPPLWGPNSFNDAAGLYRISNMARYVKYNMPLGVTHLTPILSDQEAWDVAAFIISQKRPHKEVPADWPDISKKPIDHPRGPFIDSFSEQQHQFGPFKPIQAFYKEYAATHSSNKNRKP